MLKNQLKKNQQKNQENLYYKLCQIQRSKDWFVYYYYYNDLNNKFIRFRKRVKNESSFKKREGNALRIATEINTKLIAGWNPINNKYQNNRLSIKATEKLYLKYLNECKNTNRYRSKRSRYPRD